MDFISDYQLCICLSLKQKTLNWKQSLFSLIMNLSTLTFGPSVHFTGIHNSLCLRFSDHAILDIPALPVETGSDLTLHCKMRNGSTIPAYFFINGSLTAAKPKEELKISNVQKSDEGAYSCTLVTYGRSPMSFLRVRGEDTDLFLSILHDHM